MPGAPVAVWIGTGHGVLYNSNFYYRGLHAPAYLADDVNLIADSDRRLFRSAASASSRQDVCRSTYTQHLRSFTAAGPRAWSNLPSQLRPDVSYGQFKRQLKHFCSGLTDHGASLLLAYLHLKNTLTHLFTYLLRLSGESAWKERRPCISVYYYMVEEKVNRQIMRQCRPSA